MEHKNKHVLNGVMGKQIKETELDCSPGICAGCYIPKWIGDDSGMDNRCISYGHRFEQVSGWKLEEVVREDSDTDSLTVGDAERVGDEINLTVYSDNTALLSLESNKGEFVFINLEKGAEYDWDELLGGSEYYEEEGIELTLFVDDIYYDSSNYLESYIKVTFSFKGTRTTQVPDFIYSYCGMDGRIKTQQDDWTKCQNSYECDSNLCSGRECTGINQMIKNTSVFKSLGVRIMCRFANLFKEQKYKKCLIRYLSPENADEEN